jgi:hypothetical protein
MSDRIDVERHQKDLSDIYAHFDRPRIQFLIARVLISILDTLIDLKRLLERDK